MVTTRLLYFPSLHSRDPKPVKAFKFVFEVIAKLLVNWWALGLMWLGQKTRQLWLVKTVKQLPNAMSWFRIPATVFVCYHLFVSIYNGQNGKASSWFVVMLLVQALDAIDGPCARDLDAVTEFGSRLDPASDKFCFTCIVLTYCISSFFEYSPAFCLVAFSLALWCLHVELKLIRLSIGPFRKLLNEVKSYAPEFSDPGASTAGKIKFNLQIVACVIGWIGLIHFPTDPTAILLMAIMLFAARSFGDKSLGWHRQEYMVIAWTNLMIKLNPEFRSSRRPNSNILRLERPAS